MNVLSKTSELENINQEHPLILCFECLHSCSEHFYNGVIWFSSSAAINETTVPQHCHTHTDDLGQSVMRTVTADSPS